MNINCSDNVTIVYWILRGNTVFNVSKLGTLCSTWPESGNSPR